MQRINPLKLITLYKTDDIAEIWASAQDSPVINHPDYGMISPNEYRAKNKGKPCPYCGKKMTHGKDFKTTSKSKAIQQDFEYTDKNGNKIIHHIGLIFFHPHYITLDHKLNKARFPEKLFDYDNLQIMCWRCNFEKGDDNSFDLKHNFNSLSDLAVETLKLYPLL
jgi:hypothetical protein